MSAFIQQAGTAKQILRKEGLRALFQRYGWKLVAGVFCYYLIRDLTLYVLLPFLLLK
jgi:hypothetical protein